MNKLHKILIATVAILLLVNIALITIVWNGHQRLQNFGAPDKPMPERRMERQMNLLHKRLKLSNDQKVAFENAMKAHHEFNLSTLKQEQQLRRMLHEAVFSGEKARIDSLESLALDLYKRRGKEYLDFTTTLAETCDPDQRELMLEMLDKMPPPQGDIPRPERQRPHNRDH